MINPRNCPIELQLRTNSPKCLHAEIRRVLVLLKLELQESPIYFVIEDLLDGSGTYEELQNTFILSIVVQRTIFQLCLYPMIVIVIHMGCLISLKQYG